MKILIIGGTGTIGSLVRSRFETKHEVIVGGRHSKEVEVDITNADSIQNMYERHPQLDAVVCIAGESKWAPFEKMTEEDFYVGIRGKLMSQVNLVRIGQRYLNSGGSFTLTTGILADDPVEETTGSAVANGALHSFVKAASMELKNHLRINVVSPGLVEDSVEKYQHYFPGHNPVPMKKVVNAYVKSVEGKVNGQVITIYENS